MIFYIFLINKEKNKIKNNEKIEKNKFNEINLQLINLENEKKLIEKNGEFYLNELTWDNTSKKYNFSGYLIILNTFF